MWAALTFASCPDLYIGKPILELAALLIIVSYSNPYVTIFTDVISLLYQVNLFSFSDFN